MSFMTPHVEYGEWVEIDTTQGTTVIPADLVNTDLVKRWAESDSPWAADKLEALLADYVEPGAAIYSAKLVNGWGCRLSADGYMDCTEWAVFATEQEAREYLDEMYGD